MPEPTEVKRGPGRPPKNDAAAAKRAREASPDVRSTPSQDRPGPTAAAPLYAEPSPEEANSAFAFVQMGFEAVAQVLGPHWRLPSDIRLPEVKGIAEPPTESARRLVGRPAAMLAQPVIGAAAHPALQLLGGLSGHLMVAGYITYQQAKGAKQRAEQRARAGRAAGGDRAAPPVAGADRGPEAQRKIDPAIEPVGTGFALQSARPDSRPAP